MPRRRVRRNSHVADRMRRNWRTHTRRSHRRRYMNSRTAANSASVLRKHCQRQPQHRNSDYPNSSHSSTMPFTGPETKT
jgi:hypothetical protein